MKNNIINAVDFITKNRKKWRIVCGITILIAVVFAKVGYDKAMERRLLTDNQQFAIAQYQAGIKEYEYALADLDESIALTALQIAAQKNYIDTSIYMKLDATKIHTASAQYSIQNATNQGNVLGALVSRVNDGYVLSYLSERLEIESGNLKELISCSINSNLFVINVNYTDMDTAKSILKLMEEAIDGQIQNIRDKQGDFEMVLLDETFQLRNDTAVLNGQSSNNMALKNLLVTQSDLEKKKADQIANQSKYIENNKPDTMDIRQTSVAIWVLKYIAGGVIFSLILSTCILLLAEVLREYIKEPSDIKKLNFPFLGEYRKADTEDSLYQIAFLTSTKLSQNNIQQICLCSMTEGKAMQGVLCALSKVLQKDGVNVWHEKADFASIDFLKKLVKTGNYVLLLERGKTTSEELKTEINLCSELGVKLWGCVIVDGNHQG